MIPYIGCISREDAELLKSLAERSESILEFGSGASTQIFAAYGAGRVESAETDPAWIEKTKRNLEALGLTKPVEFHLHDGWLLELDRLWDLVFVDCVDELRSQIALSMWPFVRGMGAMCFHDTRRRKPHGDSTTSDVQNVCALIEQYSPEIESVALNAADSNTTVVRKRQEPLIYVDWMVTEGRTREQMGLA
jgi:predicted O-methyltransferase YrrM